MKNPSKTLKTVVLAFATTITVLKLGDFSELSIYASTVSTLIVLKIREKLFYEKQDGDNE